MKILKDIVQTWFILPVQYTELYNERRASVGNFTMSLKKTVKWLAGMLEA